MTDHGLAALAERLAEEGIADDVTEALESYLCAAAILGERGVFLPEGLAEEWDWRQERDALMGLIESGGATIAALCAALDRHHALLTLAGDGPDKCAICAALVAAKETP